MCGRGNFGSFLDENVYEVGRKSNCFVMLRELVGVLVIEKCVKLLML